MVTITDAALRHTVFETLYDILNGLTYGASSTVTVTGAFVDSDKAIPQVVLHPVDPDFSDPVLDRSNFYAEIKVLIEIYTKKAEDIDVIADVIMNNLLTYNYSGIMLEGTDENHALKTSADVKYHAKAISLTFCRR